MDPNSLVEFVRNGLDIKEFKIKEYKNNKTQLLTSSKEDYSKIRPYLLEIKAKFFSSSSSFIKGLICQYGY